MPLAKLPPNRFAPDHYQVLIDALETARRAVCCYGGPTCDCKWGLIPSDDPADVVPISALNCKHNHCEHTGCPELRSLIERLRRSRRAWWAARSDRHALTSHGEGCCAQLDTPDRQETAPGQTHCGGYWYCVVCITEADRIHGLLPPAEPA